MMKNIFTFLGLTSVLLLFSAGFYFVSSDYFFVNGKNVDFSIIAWLAMFLLWGWAFWEYKRNDDPKGLMFASFVSLSAMCFDLYRFFIYTADKSVNPYLLAIMGCELVVFVLALFIRQRFLAYLSLGALFIAVWGTFLIYPALFKLVYIYSVVGCLCGLWFVNCLVKSEFWKKRLALLTVLVFVGALLWGGVVVYLRHPGIRFYESKILEPAKEVKVSIIVPVYNAEAVIERCLDSLRRQTLKDIEIIAVDDGSTDSTPEILARYAEHDARIRVIRQENAYVGAARNHGLREAKGEFVGFVDNDDYVSLNYYEELYKVAVSNNLNVAIAERTNFVRQAKQIFLNEVMDFTLFSDKGKDEMLTFTKFSVGYIWNKIYRKSFLFNNDIWFTTRRTIFEDWYFSISLFMYLQDIQVAQGTNYYHTMYETVNESAKKTTFKEGVFLMLADLKELIANRDLNEEQRARGNAMYESSRESILTNYFLELSDEDKSLFVEKCVAFFDEDFCVKISKKRKPKTLAEKFGPWKE